MCFLSVYDGEVYKVMFQTLPDTRHTPPIPSALLIDLWDREVPYEVLGFAKKSTFEES